MKTRHGISRKLVVSKELTDSTVLIFLSLRSCTGALRKMALGLSQSVFGVGLRWSSALESSFRDLTELSAAVFGHAHPTQLHHHHSHQPVGPDFP